MFRNLGNLGFIAVVAVWLFGWAQAAYARDFTGRWAHPDSRAAILAKPEPGAKKKARLRILTEDGLPEVYAVYRLRSDSAGRVWVRIGIPGRPNGRRGWVRAGDLGYIHESIQVLRISRRNLTAKLWRKGPSGRMKIIFRARVGLGARSTPTPRGRFWIRQKIKNLGGSPIYGPLAFGTSAYSVLSEWPGGGVIGIHGTDEPELLPGRVSHGCVRMKNGKIRVLARKLKIGTPLEIR